MIFSKFREPLIILGLFIIAVILFVVVLGFGTYNVGRERKDVMFGVTFSKLQAESLGLDWRSVYLDSMDELGVRMVRIPVYWDDVESAENMFVFDDYHWMIAEAEQRGVAVIPVLGMRVPRWPECHIPEWARIKNQKSKIKHYGEDTIIAETTPLEVDMVNGEYNRYLQSKILRLLEREVIEFKQYSNILYWQIENEPLLRTFGICPFTDVDFTRREFELVKRLDLTRKTMGTESGEMSSWIEMSDIADVLGSSLYRITFNPFLGLFYYPIPPLYYKTKTDYVSHLVERVIISELQAEPWVESSYTSLPPDYLRERFPLEFMKDNISYARKTQTDSVLLWGVEWWMYMRQKGIAEYWDYAQTLF